METVYVCNVSNDANQETPLVMPVMHFDNPLDRIDNGRKQEGPEQNGENKQGPLNEQIGAQDEQPLLPPKMTFGQTNG